MFFSIFESDMAQLQKLSLASLLKRVSFNFSQNHFKSSKLSFLGSLLYIGLNPRFYHGTAVRPGNFQNSSETLLFDSLSVRQNPPTAQAEAQEALLEYLHSTRGLPFMHAEHMSKNSPHFLEKLIEKVEVGPENGTVGRSITRYLGYHPINEFEPFFESTGLKPLEFVPFLPHNLIYLSDDNVLLENYNVLCNYGIPRNKIGRIYKEATEVFRYDCEILKSNLQTFEDVGLRRSFVCKAVASSPHILIGDGGVVFIEFVKKLKTLGIENSCIGGNLLDETFYNWTQILDLLCFFSKICSNKKQLKGLISQQPELLLEDSGNRTFSLIGFLLKCGSTMNEIRSMFLQFPQIKVKKFVENMRKCCLFLIEIGMENEEIGRIVRSHPVLIGSCSLKAARTLLENLKSGRKRIREIIKEDPEVLRTWVLQSRVEQLPRSGERLRSQKQKSQFFQDLGFVENSNEMKKAVKLCGGKGWELSERLDCFVKAGLDQKDVFEMMKRAPRVLQQSKGVIQSKIDLIMNDYSYPISSIAASPSCIGFTIQRVKLRFTMYDWLKDQGAAEPNLALATILSCSDKYFIKNFVNRVPRGPKVWDDFKKWIYQE